MMTIPRVKWLSQRDNINAWTESVEANNQCMIASFTMIMQWLREFLSLSNLPSFENYTEHTHYILVTQNEKNSRNRYISNIHASVLNEMLKNRMIPYKFVAKLFSYKEVMEYVNATKRPVLIGTMETSAGHIVVYDGQFQNPYGRPAGDITLVSCKYKDVKGDNLDYSNEFAENMVFREMVFDKENGWRTSKTNVRRPCWVIENI